MKAWINCFILIFFILPLYSDAILKSDFIEVDYKNDIWYMKKNVFVNTSSYILKANQMTFYRKTKQILALGAVKITFKKDQKEIEALRFEKKGSKKFFSGKPLKVTDPKNKRKIYSKRLQMSGKAKSQNFLFEDDVKVEEEDKIIKAPKLNYYEKKEILQLKGKSVIEKIGDKTTITSKDIDYNDKKSIAYFKNPVNIEKKDSTITGKKGTYQDKEGLLKLEHVFFKSGNKKVRSEEMDTITRKKKKVYVFKKNVRFEKGDFKGTTKILEYIEDQKVTILKEDAKLRDSKKDLDIESSLMRIDDKKAKIYFLGHVYIKQKDKILRGSMGVYDQKSEILVVRGNPYYKKGSDVTYAQVIALNTKTNEVKMKGNITGSFKQEQSNSKENKTEKKQEAKKDNKKPALIKKGSSKKNRPKLPGVKYQ